MVAGLGRAGLAASRALIRFAGADQVLAWDGKPEWEHVPAAARELRSAGARCAIGGVGVELLSGPSPPRCLVKSPGIAFESPLVAAALDRGLEVLDEAELAWRLDDRPMTAVTGTNGKSTTCRLLGALLEASGRRPLLGGNTLHHPPLSALGGGAVRGDVIVAELSSFQLEGCPDLIPDTAVFTNLTSEHLGRHRSMERYSECKRRMFVRGERAVALAALNVDDPFGAALAHELAARGSTVIGYGRGAEASFRLRGASWSLRRARLLVDTPAGPMRIETQLPGEHNAYNVLAALAVAHGLGIDAKECRGALAVVGGLPGRFERVVGPAEVDVIVDYAHNPAGVRVTLETARAVLAQRPGSRLHGVVSALTIDDCAKRRGIGRAAGERCDRLVLTTERWWPTEPLDRLPPGLEEGARDSGASPEIVLRRRDAIRDAIGRAAPGDLVVILGRGGQSGPLFDGVDAPAAFDDRVEARRALEAGAGLSEPSQAR